MRICAQRQGLKSECQNIHQTDYSPLSFGDSIIPPTTSTGIDQAYHSRPDGSMNLLGSFVAKPELIHKFYETFRHLEKTNKSCTRISTANESRLAGAL
jgi:hypothetical protein